MHYPSHPSGLKRPRMIYILKMDRLPLDLLLTEMCAQYLGVNDTVALACTCKFLLISLHAHITDREAARFRNGFPFVRTPSHLWPNVHVLLYTSTFRHSASPFPDPGDKLAVAVRIYIDTPNRSDLANLCSYLTSRKVPILGLYINGKDSGRGEFSTVLDDFLLAEVATHSTSVVLVGCDSVSDKGISSLKSCRYLKTFDCHGFTSHSVSQLSYGLPGHLVFARFHQTYPGLGALPCRQLHPSLEAWQCRQLQHAPAAFKQMLTVG